jgi:uncharacterized protein (DUF2236 family)
MPRTTSYHAYVRPLTLSERNYYYAEGIAAAALYGAISAPRSEADLEMLFHATAGGLERSEIVFEFLAIMRSTPILPLPLRPFQQLLVRAAIDLTPRWLRTILRLNELGLRAWETAVVRRAAAFVDRIVLETNPAVQACRRMGLPADYLYPQNIAKDAINSSAMLRLSVGGGCFRASRAPIPLCTEPPELVGRLRQ